MVIGNGLIGKAFEEFSDDERYLFFCSGVSNSLCSDELQFSRERNMVHQHIGEHPDKKFIYFSTTSIEDPSMKDSRYVTHKLAVEELIKTSCKDYCIFRLSNVVGKTLNKFTVLNFLYNSVRDGEPFNLWKNASRNLIDINDVLIIVKYLLANHFCDHKTINIANTQSYEVTYIVALIEEYLNKKGNYTLVDKGIQYTVDTSSIHQAISALNIRFDSNYAPRLLAKYYPR